MKSVSDLRRQLLEADIEELPDLSKIAIIAIGLSPNIGTTRLQKELFFIDKVFSCGGDAESYYFGAFSEDLTEQVGAMIDDGTVYVKNDRYDLTKYGEDLAPHLQKGKPEIVEFLNALKGFTDNEILKSTYELFSEFTDKSLIKGRLPACPNLHFSSIGFDDLKTGEKELLTGDIKIKISLAEDEKR